MLRREADAEADIELVRSFDKMMILASFLLREYNVVNCGGARKCGRAKKATRLG